MDTIIPDTLLGLYLAIAFTAIIVLKHFNNIQAVANRAAPSPFFKDTVPES
jgi:hypothetical protein